MIENSMYEVLRDIQSSGRLKNPWKHFFLKLAQNTVRDVGLQREEGGVCYARKEIIRCGLALNFKRMWEEKQLTQQL